MPPAFAADVGRKSARRPRQGARRAGAVALLSACCLPLFAEAPTGAIATPAETSATLAEMSIEQLVNLEVASVYGASRYQQETRQAPAAVSVITADEIRKLGDRTLADVLRGVRGLYVPYDRTYSYLGMRGFQQPGDYNSRVLLLVDGHRLNENLYGSCLLGNEAVLDVDLIDRVEVIRGPSSSIYGESAFLGVVNVITKRGRQLDGVEVSGALGDLETRYARMSYGRLLKNDMEVLLSASWYESDGWNRLYYPEFDPRISDNPRAANDGYAEHIDHDQALKLFGRLTWRDFTFEAAGSDRRKQVPTASFHTVFNDPRMEVNDVWGYANLKYEHEFASDVTVMGRVSYDHYGYKATYPTDYAEPGDSPFIVLNKDDNVGDWLTVEGQATKRIADRHTVIVGADYRNNFHQSELNYDDDPYAVWTDEEGRSWNAGVYAQGEVSLRTNVVLTAGGRFDYYDSFGSTLNPRAGVIYSPWNPTTFKVLYGEAFRAPNRYELYYDSNLHPETIRTFEVVWEQLLTRHHRLSLSAYHQEIGDLIASTDTGYVNLNEARGQGMEIELDSRLSRGLSARFSYSLQHSEEVHTGEELSNSPRHLGRLNLIVPLYRDKLFSGLELDYTSGVKTLGGHHTDDFLVANLTLFSQNLIKGVELSASVYNLFDTDYAYPAGAGFAQDVIPQDGRTFRVKLTYHF